MLLLPEQQPRKLHTGFQQELLHRVIPGVDGELPHRWRVLGKPQPNMAPHKLPVRNADGHGGA